MDNHYEKSTLGRLGHVFNSMNGKNKSHLNKEGKPYVPYRSVSNHPFIHAEQIDYIRIEPREKQNKVNYGDILFCRTSEKKGRAGASAIVLESLPELYLDDFCFGFGIHDFNTLYPLFAAHYFRSEPFRSKIPTITQGGTRQNIVTKQFKGLRIPLPPIQEQKKTAHALYCAAKESGSYIKYLKALKKQKIALSQRLLSGQIRVKTP